MSYLLHRQFWQFLLRATVQFPTQSPLAPHWSCKVQAFSSRHLMYVHLSAAQKPNCHHSSEKPSLNFCSCQKSNVGVIQLDVFSKKITTSEINFHSLLLLFHLSHSAGEISGQMAYSDPSSICLLIVIIFFSCTCFYTKSFMTKQRIKH